MTGPRGRCTGKALQPLWSTVGECLECAQGQEGSTGSAIWEAHNESRPNTVMNHGAPRSYHHPVRVVRVFDAKCSQVIVAAPEGSLDGRIAHVKHWDLSHPLPAAPVAQ